MDDVDARMMRRCIALSVESGREGEYPYGVVIVRDGAPVTESTNRVSRERDVTRHAEVVAISAAQKALGTVSLDDCTIYVSAEPCAYCCYAIRESRIGRVVYGLSEGRLKQMTGNHPENPTLFLPCRTVFAAGQREVKVTGPLLEDEAAAQHKGVWG